MARSGAPAFWSSRGAAAVSLLPLAALFGGLAALRRTAFTLGLAPSRRAAVPVIVIGNVAVGGSGKTPVAIWLIEQLRQAGYRPGIVSRGYGRRSAGVRVVTPDTPVDLAGDEPLLLAREAACPVVVGADRPAAIEALLAHCPECSVVVSDDGMQHYAMHRDVELAVVDPCVIGNRWLLPAGPLREPLSRLRRTDLVLLHGEPTAPILQALGDVPRYAMRLEAGAPRRLDGQGGGPLAGWRGRRVHAVAGIGRPERFFETLRTAGLEPIPHPFPDHHRFSAEDLRFDLAVPILMTCKDAVKCRPFAPRDSWELPVRAVIGAGALETILEKLPDGQSPA